MIKAVIFDMDGLMIDSERITFEGYQHVLKKMNLTMEEDFYLTLLGKPIPAIHQSFYEKYGEDFPIEDVIKEVHHYMEQRFINEGVPLKEGLVELLKYLKKYNYKTIVATSSQRKRVDQILKSSNLIQYFDDSICGDEVTKGKPNPEVFLKACLKLGVDPSETIVLEDSEAGIQASFSAKIPVICIPDMKYPEEPYASMATIMSSLKDVKEYLLLENQDSKPKLKLNYKKTAGIIGTISVIAISSFLAHKYFKK